METVTRETKKGTVESLALSRWVQPYSDEATFNVERNSIVIMTPASAGLSRYYEYVLDGMNRVIVSIQQSFWWPEKAHLLVDQDDMTGTTIVNDGGLMNAPQISMQ